VYSQSQIDPVVSFRNTQGEAVRGTIFNLQRNSLVMEIYNSLFDCAGQRGAQLI